MKQVPSKASPLVLPILGDTHCWNRSSSAASSPAIQVKGLTKIYQTYKKQPGLAGAIKGLLWRQYERTVAAADINFQVEAGELVGFLGPNGAGKTTTLKMLAGLLYPSSGTASVLGFTPWERDIRYRRQFALLLGQKNQLWWDLPARDSLELNSKIYGVPRAQFERTLGELVEMLDVEDKLNVMVRELSLGERMKMEMIAALLHRPKVLFLDEPTIGLDVIAQTKVREFLKTYNELNRTTILLTSHYMADIQALCQRVIIVAEGGIIYDGPLSQISNCAANHKIVTLQCKDFETMASTPWTKFGDIAEINQRSVALRVPREKIMPVCRELLVLACVTDIKVEDEPIENVMRDLFAGGDQPCNFGALTSHKSAGDYALVRDESTALSPMAVRA